MDSVSHHLSSRCGLVNLDYQGVCNEVFAIEVFAIAFGQQVSAVCCWPPHRRCTLHQVPLWLVLGGTCIDWTRSRHRNRFHNGVDVE